jgi:hypothetical protein
VGRAAQGVGVGLGATVGLGSGLGVGGPVDGGGRGVRDGFGFGVGRWGVGDGRGCAVLASGVGGAWSRICSGGIGLGCPCTPSPAALVAPPELDNCSAFGQPSADVGETDSVAGPVVPSRSDPVVAESGLLVATTMLTTRTAATATAVNAG